MTNLQNAILEACNDGVITSHEGAYLFNTIYCESMIDDMASNLHEINKSINSVFKRFVAWLNKNTIENRKKKFLVQTSFMSELDNIKKSFDGLNTAKDTDEILNNLEELTLNRKELSKNKFMMYSDSVKVPSGYKAYTTDELYKLIMDIANTVVKLKCKADIKTAFKVLNAKIVTYWSLSDIASTLDSICGNGPIMTNGEADIFRDYMTRNAVSLSKMKENAKRIYDNEYARNYAKYDTFDSYGVVII